MGGHVLDHLEPQSVRMSSALAGGVGGTHQEMCGALSGSIMVIGGLYGRVKSHEDDGLARDLATVYRSRFLAAFGHTQCEPVRQMFRQPDGSGSCAPLVERAAQILLELLASVKT